MKKLMMLSAALLAMQAVPALAQDGPKPHKDGKGMERFFEKQDANKDGVISEDEAVAAAKARFAEVDANKDGKVTKDEAKAHHDAMRAKWKEKREEMKKLKEEAPKQ